VRRSYETIYVFEFDDKGVVSIVDSVTEFAYYWVFGYFIAKSSAANNITPSIYMKLLWVLLEYCNHSCHVTLAKLKREHKGGKRKPPRGNYLFNYVSCPHYFFEISGWFVFNACTGFTVPGVLFMCVGAVIMTCWAAQRHDSYDKDDTKTTTPLFPFVDVRPHKFLVDALAR